MRRTLFVASGALGLAAAFFVGCGASSSADEAVQEGELREDAASEAGPDAGSDARADAPALAPASLTDARDGKVYRTVTIGAATWLARNLDWAGPGSYCWGDDPRSCVRDGRLYGFAAAKAACPSGTHLATDDDWKALEAALGMSAADRNREGYSTIRGRDEGTKLKAEMGFAASHGAGFRTGADYDARDDRTYYWTATTRGADVWRRRITEAEPTVFRFTNPPEGFAISVRCVAD